MVTSPSLRTGILPKRDQSDGNKGKNSQTLPRGFIAKKAGVLCSPEEAVKRLDLKGRPFSSKTRRTLWAEEGQTNVSAWHGGAIEAKSFQPNDFLV